MPKKVVILTEGGAGKGFGHIARCLALYQAFEEAGCACSLMINGDDSIKTMLSGCLYEIFNWLKDQGRLEETLSNGDIVIVDSYLAEIKDYQQIARLGCTTVYIDDNARVSYANGILVNGTNFTHLLSFDQIQPIKKILGQQYIMIRKDFWDVQAQNPNTEVKRIFISLGGGDQKNLTPRLMQAVQKLYPKSVYDVVVTDAFQNKEKIRQALNEKGCYVASPSAEEMKEMMLQSDLALTACGQTLYELMRLGVASMGVAVSENQVKCAQALEECGYMSKTLIWNNKDMEIDMEKELARLVSQQQRVDTRTKGQNIVDGQGARRIVQEILNG